MIVCNYQIISVVLSCNKHLYAIEILHYCVRCGHTPLLRSPPPALVLYVFLFSHTSQKTTQSTLIDFSCLVISYALYWLDAHGTQWTLAPLMCVMVSAMDLPLHYQCIVSICHEFFVQDNLIVGLFPLSKIISSCNHASNVY